MSQQDGISRPADTMRERVGESRIRLWFLITANRWIVTVIISVVAYLLFILLKIVGPSSIQNLLTTSGVATVFSSIIIAVVTSVTLVLTISQLVLSQEVGPLTEQRQRMQGAIDFREDVRDLSAIPVSPSNPSRFLQTLIRIVDTHAQTLNETISDESDPDEFADLVEYLDGIIEHGQEVRAELDTAEFGSFGVLLPVLNYNYSWKIFAARHFRAEHSDSLSEEADDTLADLIETLRFFGPAREHFKTLYFQWEIVNISRALLYGSMPTLMLSGYMILVFEPMDITGTVFGFSQAYLFVGAMYVIALSPFAVLLAYLLRVLTVAKRTLAIGPFILRESEQLEQFHDE